MRFFHLSDLHIGRHLHGYSLLEQQKQVLGQVLRWAEEKKPDAIVIAGDIYDKVSPSGEAVLLFDWFLTELSLLRPQIPLLLISGNHDSSMRLKYASELMKKNRIYVAARTPEGQEEHLQKLYDAAYRQDAKIRSLVQELVPEYVTGNERNNIIAYAPRKGGQKYTGRGNAAERSKARGVCE